MAKTDAERQRDWRERRKSRISELEGENAELRAELERVRVDLEDARAEIDRLSGPECDHPAEGMNGTYCTGCKTDLW